MRLDLRVRAAGDKIIQESGSAWVDIPGDLAEGAVVEMLIIVNESHDLDKVTATQIGQWMGAIDENGGWK